MNNLINKYLSDFYFIKYGGARVYVDNAKNRKLGIVGQEYGKSKKTIVKPKIVSCKKFKKTKEPICDKQQGCKWVVKKGCLNVDSDSSVDSDNKLKFRKFLDKIHSISGICNYTKIDLSSGPIILNIGDLHTWSDRSQSEAGRGWLQLCKENNNKEKKIISFKNSPAKFYETSVLAKKKKLEILNLDLKSILKKNEMFISYFILYIFKNFKNVHLFLEFHDKNFDYSHDGRHATPMLYNKSLIQMSRSQSEFLKQNGNFIHHNDFRNEQYIYYNLLNELYERNCGISKSNNTQAIPLKKITNKNFSKNECIDLIKKIYIQVFLQGYKPSISAKSPKWQKDVNKFMKYDNKHLVNIIIEDLGILKKHAEDFISNDGNVSRPKHFDEKNNTIKINGRTIHCTKISKQLLKLKPEIQDKVVKWFYDLIISKLDNIIVTTQYSNITINYIFKIMFIDFYNLCRILYYTGYGNTNIDMSNNIIINYGGENMYLYKPTKYSFFNILDNNTGGHASSVSLFYRKYLYGNEGKGNRYVEKPGNWAINQKRHFHFKNKDIEIKKYLSRYTETKTTGRDCVEIK